MLSHQSSQHIHCRCLIKNSGIQDHSSHNQIICSLFALRIPSERHDTSRREGWSRLYSSPPELEKADHLYPYG